MQVWKVLTWLWILGAVCSFQLHRAALNISGEPLPQNGTEVKRVPSLCAVREKLVTSREYKIPFLHNFLS